MLKSRRKTPPVLRPKLNTGATILLDEHPKSLRAFLRKLNHGENAIEILINVNGIRIAIRPNVKQL